MEIAVEISLYPLDAAYIPPIQSFIDRLNTAARLKVVTTSLSTQIFGEYEDVFGTLAREMRTTFADVDKAVFVMKVIGPLAPPGQAA
jgi:hypothetical protein